ncbi:hypothetical protein H4R33_005293 [Dimargaris cristalligena]|uniref:MIT domain-containing protein n=1 Tax=Dimargaris cristalligena TaxID=215637 RepID=A0A4V1J533_9FUNG|nr:hypothetical protein H4R33_005293 [Dimargaris cristalligena]RKP37659.1 hypothetical protein BJ085DRAFT_40878 [Dimargaris cristalligena]|eukprot:RKP37659.1 hypothetical protein BJ085DRAFT_40878 [Dimargaris cristalligena]
MEGSFSSKAHAWAGLAEDYYNRGKPREAIRAHAKAAELFAQALSNASDIQTVEAFKRLAISHKKIASEIQVEVDRNADTYGDTAEDPPSAPFYNRALGLASPSDASDDARSTTSETSTAESDMSSTQSEAHPPFGETPSDPIENFWDFVENLVDRIASPTAMSTSPATPGQSPSPHIVTHCARHAKKQPAQLGRSSIIPSIAESYYVVPEQHGLAEISTILEKTIRNPTVGEANPDLSSVDGNDKMRQTITALQKHIAVLEKAAKENTMLRSSIYNFQQEVHKKARDYKLASDGTKSILYRPPPTAAATISNQHDICDRRIHELETELSRMKTIVHKQDEMLLKYKDRWDKLKESAKKKRESRRDSSA